MSNMLDRRNFLAITGTLFALGIADTERRRRSPTVQSFGSIDLNINDVHQQFENVQIYKDVPKNMLFGSWGTQIPGNTIANIVTYDGQNASYRLEGVQENDSHKLYSVILSHRDRLIEPVHAGSDYNQHGLQQRLDSETLMHSQSSIYAALLSK